MAIPTTPRLPGDSTTPVSRGHGAWWFGLPTAIRPRRLEAGVGEPAPIRLALLTTEIGDEKADIVPGVAQSSAAG